MTSETDLVKTSKVVSLLDGYQDNDFKDPAVIDEAVEATDLNFLKKSWESIHEDVKKIYAQQGRLSNNLRAFQIIAESTLLAFLVINGSAILLKIQILLTFTSNIILVTIVVGILISYAISRHEITNKLKENREKNINNLDKIKSEVQNLILNLDEKIRLEKKDPKEYKIRLRTPDYQGITVKGRPRLGLLGSEYYIANPSLIGAAFSKAKEFIEIIDPLPFERETTEALLRVHAKVKIRMLISREEAKYENVQNTLKRLKAHMPNLSILSCDLDDLAHTRFVITEGEAWCTTEEGWCDLVEVENAKKRKALEKTFEEKWSYAENIIR